MQDHHIYYMVMKVTSPARVILSMDDGYRLDLIFFTMVDDFTYVDRVFTRYLVLLIHLPLQKVWCVRRQLCLSTCTGPDLLI